MEELNFLEYRPTPKELRRRERKRRYRLRNGSILQILTLTAILLGAFAIAGNLIEWLAKI